ncbi:MAG: T9SS type A sorting domain-containing protein [Sporocytophaga sp.]|nr:T9SS type A sorting domain-containing protein [Sporocytophaga sp.]
MVFELIPDCGHADVILYSSNGTPAGTVLFRSLLQDGYISRFLLIDNFLVFKTSVQGDPGVIGRTDATYDGTVPFHSLNSEPTRPFERVGDLLFFADNSDGSHGNPDTPNGYFQLYQSGLEYDNTETLQDLYGGSYAGADNLTEANRKLFFTTQNLHNEAPPEEKALKLYYYNPLIALSRVGNSDLVSDNKLEVYPNPSVGTFNFTVQSKNDAIAKADIYTIEGIFVENLFQGKTSFGQEIEFIWDASKYQEGMYICKYNSGNEFKIMKITKTNK